MSDSYQSCEIEKQTQQQPPTSFSACH